MFTRRTFIVAGIAGGTALTAAYWLRSTKLSRMSLASSESHIELDSEATTIIAAIVPAMLENALPIEPAERRAAIDETAANVLQAIGGLAPSAQRELAELFSLLAFPPARIALARVTSSWATAPPPEVRAFLDRWRTSDWKLLRSAYHALHQLVYGTWYANPRAWSAIGYPGPPVL